ncbi:MAG TPA: segregation/condensation protein A, partial [Anaerolineae bacterium]|nr:segregation/condensation protein A [Anaerolineae bacterium]
QVTEQYLGYIAVMEQLRIELAAEYLLMAALLAEIKSRLLLPRPQDDDGEEEDPRAELVRRLKEYERIKQAALALDALPRLGRDLFPVVLTADMPPRPQSLPRVTLDQLAEAFRQVLLRAEQYQSHAVARETLSVRERMGRLLELLKGNGLLAFEVLFDPGEGRAGLVVTFLALLELCKEGMVEVIQREPMAPIQVKIR